MRLYPAGVNILEPLQVENEYWGKSPNLKFLVDLLVGLALCAIDLILLAQLFLLGEGLRHFARVIGSVAVFLLATTLMCYPKLLSWATKYRR